MIDTVTLSRRIVAAIDPDGTRWPEWVAFDLDDGIKIVKTRERVPDLAQPCNLHLLLEVASSFKCQFDIDYFPLAGIATEHQYSFKMTWPIYGERYHNADLSLAILAAVCAALGIDTTQETTHAE